MILGSTPSSEKVKEVEDRGGEDFPRMYHRQNFATNEYEKYNQRRLMADASHDFDEFIKINQLEN